ncbi:MAG: hypothetical protein U0234_25845 [Sandaracinus sp.]
MRDALELDPLVLGVRAIALHPQKSKKRGLGEREVPIRFAGASIRPGDHVVVDEDGIVVCDASLAITV